MKNIAVKIVILTFSCFFCFGEKHEVFKTSIGSNDVQIKKSLHPGENQDGIIYPSLPGNPPDYSSQFNMANYFSNLKTNFPYNHYGTCGYTALSMILSYYDTFYNDNIIPEAYDVNDSLSSSNVNYSSPGVRHHSDTYSYSGHTLKQYVENTYLECLDSLLIRRKHNNPNLDSYKSGLSGFNAATLIDSYYNQYGLFPIFESGTIGNNPHTFGFEYEDLLNCAPMGQLDGGFYNWIVEEAQNKTEEMLEVTISYINQGIPVLLSLFDGFILNPNYNVPGTEYNEYYYLYSGNHVVVAYDTTFVDGIEIPLCHFGWESAYSVPYNYSNYAYIFNCVPISCNWQIHSHSNNYNINNLIFCGCGHHTHSFAKEYVNPQKHSITCGCGYLNYANHTDNLFYSCCGGDLDYPPGVLNHEDDE